MHAEKKKHWHYKLKTSPKLQKETKKNNKIKKQLQSIFYIKQEHEEKQTKQYK